MARVNRTVSIEAEREYVIALGALAQRNGLSMGAFVRKAVDAYCKADLDQIQDQLAQVDTSKYQSISSGISELSEAVPDAAPIP